MADDMLPDFDKLVRRIVLDVSLLRWFALNGHRVAVLDAIALTREGVNEKEQEALTFLETHVGA